MWQRWCNMCRSQREYVGGYLIYFYKTGCIEELKWKRGREGDKGVHACRCAFYMTACNKWDCACMWVGVLWSPDKIAAVTNNTSHHTLSKSVTVHLCSKKTKTKQLNLRIYFSCWLPSNIIGSTSGSVNQHRCSWSLFNSILWFLRKSSIF